MDLSVVIPFYNEEENIAKVLERVSDILCNVKHEIIAVNNGSSDETSQIIDKYTWKNLRKVSLKKNLGYGHGVTTGFNNATGKYLCWIDGDGQLDPKCILSLYKMAKKKGPAMYKTKRSQRKDGLQRKILSIGYNKLTKLLFGIDSQDINSCPKLFPRELFEKYPFESKDWFIDTEVMIKAKKMGLKTHEIPVIFNKRTSGSSNVYYITIGEFINNIFRYYSK